MNKIHASDEFIAEVCTMSFRPYYYHELIEYLERQAGGLGDPKMYRAAVRMAFSLSMRCGRSAEYTLEGSEALRMAVSNEFYRVSASD